jgi:phosphatidylserine/phosphatidylglycerophosphate/cardiolipin synthase-like enzyme
LDASAERGHICSRGGGDAGVRGTESAANSRRALEFARSTAVTIEPVGRRREFLPSYLADVEAARSSVQILMFGWREREAGMQRLHCWRGSWRTGVEVRVIVDALGSRPYGEACETFTGLAAARRRSSSPPFPARPERPLPRRPARDWRPLGACAKLRAPTTRQEEAKRE